MKTMRKASVIVDDALREIARLKAINAELLAALTLARELLDRNDIRRPEIDAVIAKAEGLHD